MKHAGAIDTQRISAAVLRTTVLANLLHYADQIGRSSDAWFAGLRMGREAVDDYRTLVSYRQVRAILHRALPALPANAGLEVGRRQTLGNFGLLGLAMSTAPTFGEAVRIGLAYPQLAGTLMDLSLETVSLDTVAVGARMRVPDQVLEPFMCEELFASIQVLSRAVIDADFRFKRLELAYPAPAYASEYRDLFRCNVAFDAMRNRALFDRAWLDSLLPSRHPMHKQQALALCQANLPPTDASSEIVAAVERLLYGQLDSHPKVADIAAELHVTERTLRRQLAVEGTGFKALHNRLRAEYATDLLLQRHQTIEEIGKAIGFKDAREFCRAFKRWTGVSPRVLRAQPERLPAEMSRERQE